MLKAKNKLNLKYDTPRLTTYGTLKELTKGTISGSTDDGGNLKGDTN